MKNYRKQPFIWIINKTCPLLILISGLIFLSCNRKVYVCGFPYDVGKLEFRMVDTIIHDHPNLYIISGKIFENKQPLIGVSIYLSISKLGTASDVDGTFYLEIPLEKISKLEKEVVHFSYIGYQSLEVELKGLINRKILVEVNGY